MSSETKAIEVIQPGFNYLPEELWQEVCTFLPAADLDNMSLVNLQMLDSVGYVRRRDRLTTMKLNGYQGEKFVMAGS